MQNTKNTLKIAHLSMFVSYTSSQLVSAVRLTFDALWKNASELWMDENNFDFDSIPICVFYFYSHVVFLFSVILD